jgi:ATP-dependent protease ClpP protease subunit
MSVLRSKNTKVIYVTGEINDESFKLFHQQVAVANANKVPIHLVIHSEGGVSLSALAYYDVIRSYPFVTSCSVHGCAQSAATLIFAACKKRFMGRSAWLMFHEDQHGDLPDMSTTSVEVLADRARRFERQWLQLMHESTGLSIDTLRVMHQNETWLNYAECLNLDLLSEKK